MRNRKRGVSAIEMIISFLLFLGFLAFIFAYLNPFKEGPSFSGTESLYSEIEKTLSIQINSIGLNIEGSGDCFVIKNLFYGNVFVLDENGNKINAERMGEDVMIEGGKNFYYIYDNAEDSKSKSLESCKTPEKYSWSVKSNELVFSFDKMKKMNESYYAEYNSLKNLLKIPAGKSFAIMVYDSSRKKIFDMTRTIPKTETISLEYPIEMLKENSIQKGAIRIIEW